jgi:hypothetical protein
MRPMVGTSRVPGRARSGCRGASDGAGRPRAIGCASHNVFGELPLVDDELRRGALSYCKVRAITRVATPANEAALVEMAKHSTGAQLDRICRKYAAVQRQGTDPDPRYDDEQRYVSRRELENGFVEISARLHPEEAAAVWAALDRIVKERAHARSVVDVSAETPACVTAAAFHEVTGPLSVAELVSASEPRAGDYG